MGLFDFVRDAGEKIFGKDDKPSPAAKKPGAKPTAAPAGGAAKAPVPTWDELREKALTQLLEKHGFGVTALKVDVAGERVTVTGKVATQEVREKVILVLGNTAGVAQVDDRLVVERKEPAGAPANEAQFYTVKPGDTLSKIAKQYYGNASKYPAIFEANKPMLKDPDKIYPGQVLRIPGAAT
jgi:nucleoid-associated protein YgaU